MRIIDITHPPQSLWIGREGENTFRPVSFECANWFSAYPNATIAAYYQPYGVSDPYPLVLVEDGTKRIWHPLLNELVKGDGELQIVLMQGETVGTSAIIPTKVDRSLISNADHPASESPSWAVEVVQDVTEQADRAKAAADRAEEAYDPAAIAGAVEDYLDEHPVSVEETDPTVPAWAKQPTKPTYTASEVGALPSTYVAPVQSVNGMTGNVVIPTGDPNAVLYTPQSLTPAQQAQARENIGAFSSDAGDEIRDAFETRQVAGSSNLLNPAEAIDGYSITNTNDTPAVNANYYYSDFMPVDAGKTYTLQRGGLTVAQGRAIAGIKWIAAYDESKTLQTTKGSAGISAGNGYTVPEGVAYVRICASKVYWPLTSHNVAFVEGMEPQDYTPYVVPTETLGALKPAYHDDEHILSLIDAHDGETSGLTYSFDLDTNGFTADEDTQDAQDYSIAFTAPISSGFEGVIIGRGYNAAYGGWVKVTGTEVSYGLGTEAEPRATYTHGLTLADYIAVKLIADAGTTMTLTVSTNGGEWSKSRLTWDCMKGVLSVQPVGNTTLSGCNLGYWCNGWAASTQLYGDSYFGKYASKWTSYLVANGCTDVLVNGYPGRASATALTAAKTVLAHSQPKRIVWCVGMNNGDTGGVVNAAWKVAVDELGSICDARGVELILATIPNVATVDNTYKNAYVRASGRRYIDFASAVGAENDTTWYGGMLSSDGVHPAVPGALALYRQAIADVPELMEKQDVPTKTSDLTNDSGYQTAAQVQTAIAAAAELPTGGSTGDFLRKTSSGVAWETVPAAESNSFGGA